MCGEIDENVTIGHDLLEQLKVMSSMLGVTLTEAESANEGPKNLDTAEGRAAYMQSLFLAGLRRALADSDAAEPEEKVDALASQAIAFARLSGFLAGQLPPEADLFRAISEAMISGHGETARLSRIYHHKQDEAHGHSHDDDHDHDHDHHHHHHH